MTSLPLPLLRALQSASPKEAWAALLDDAWQRFAAPLSANDAAKAASQRDAALAPVDLFLATAAWDLWVEYERAAPRTAPALIEWWEQRRSARAILILDALSLRELPWLLQGAGARGYVVHQARPTAAELPAETTPFAKALGLSGRSALESGGSGVTGRLRGAKTESTSAPWEECARMIDATPDWILWHGWPDDRVHDLAGPGPVLKSLADEASRHLLGDPFWHLVRQLTTGRRLVITADHGYAESAGFPDVSDPAQAQYLKERFKSGRSAATTESTSGSASGGEPGWVPPLDVQLQTAHGDRRFVLGRRKWKSPGGYPTLTHGGLSLLEVAVPFLELSRPGGS